MVFIECKEYGEKVDVVSVIYQLDKFDISNKIGFLLEKDIEEEYHIGKYGVKHANTLTKNVWIEYYDRELTLEEKYTLLLQESEETKQRLQDLENQYRIDKGLI